MPAVPRHAASTTPFGNLCPRDALANAVKSRNLMLSNKNSSKSQSLLAGVMGIHAADTKETEMALFK